jgi:hypothetical protein
MMKRFCGRDLRRQSRVISGERDLTQHLAFAKLKVAACSARPA